MRRIFAAALLLVSPVASAGSASADSQDFDRIERGRYLAVLAM